MPKLSASKVQWPELSQLSLCSEFDKENSMEFLLISLLLIHFTTVAMRLLFHGPHVTLVMWHTVTVTSLWHCDKVTWYSPMLHLVVISPIRKEKKRNINNDLAVLPSHDINSPEPTRVSHPFSWWRILELPWGIWRGGFVWCADSLLERSPISFVPPETEDKPLAT